jgi:hypothetical protein
LGSVALSAYIYRRCIAPRRIARYAHTFMNHSTTFGTDRNNRFDMTIPDIRAYEVETAQMFGSSCHCLFLNFFRIRITRDAVIYPTHRHNWFLKHMVMRMFSHIVTPFVPLIALACSRNSCSSDRPYDDRNHRLAEIANPGAAAAAAVVCMHVCMYAWVDCKY